MDYYNDTWMDLMLKVGVVIVPDRVLCTSVFVRVHLVLYVISRASRHKKELMSL